MRISKSTNINVKPTVNNINIDSLSINDYGNNPLFIVNENNNNELNITINTITYDKELNIIEKRQRKIKYNNSLLHCDNQAFIHNYNSKQTCINMNLYYRKCQYISEGKYNSNQIEKDISCPCNKKESECTIIIKGIKSYTLSNEINKLQFDSTLQSLEVHTTELILELNKTTTVKQTTHPTITINGKGIIYLKEGEEEYLLNTTSKEILFISSTGYDASEQKQIKVTRNGSCEVSKYNDKTKQIDCLTCKGTNNNGKCEFKKDMKHCISTYKDIVCSVCEDKYYEGIICKTCGEYCRRCKNEKECVLCSDGYKLNEKGLCEENSKIIQNKIVQCSICEYPFNATCYLCKDKDNHSEECNYKETFICSTSDYSNGVCSNENKGINSSNSNGDICNKGYYNINNTCESCKTTYGECKQCDSTQCHECEEEYYISNGKCIYNENKCIITESKCIRCINSSEWYKTGECSICTENCYYCINKVIKYR